MRTFLKVIVALGVLGVCAVLVVYFAFTGAGVVPPPSRDLAQMSPAETAQMRKSGRHVVDAGDCAACHSSTDGLSLAGGTAMETPMGTLYGTNITPDERTGIANYTAEDLYRVMVYGIAPGGRHLYPAMPYVSYHAISRADVDALWVWLMAQNPVERANKPTEMMFPFNIRPAVAFWNLIYRPDPPETAVAGLTDNDAIDPIARGEYLVDVLGHCSECHTPRNALFAKKKNEHLKGNVIENAYSPDISPEGLAARGWSRETLAQFLSIGVSPEGVMTLGMFPVLSHSTKYLPKDDIDAITAYLVDGMPDAHPPVPDLAALDDHPQGHSTYLGLCAGCHGADGEGQPHSSVPMKGNTTLMFDDPINLIRVVNEGIEARALAKGERMQEMPAFAHRLSDGEMAELANYLRQRWGGKSGRVTAEDVSGIVSGG